MSHNTQKWIDRVCLQRGLPPIKKGMRCEVEGRQGKVIGGNCSANLNIRFDGERFTRNCHPYWKMKIYNADGVAVWDSEMTQ